MAHLKTARGIARRSFVVQVQSAKTIAQASVGAVTVQRKVRVWPGVTITGTNRVTCGVKSNGAVVAGQVNNYPATKG